MFVLFASAAGTFGGCGTGSDDDAGGGDGSGASASNGTSSSPNGNGSTGDGFSNASSTSSGQGGGCAGISSTAQKVPLDMYIMLAQSGSMSDPAQGGGSKWQAVTSALTTFINQPEAAGIGVGIQYFPLQGASCNVLMCTSDAQCGVGCGPCTLGQFCQGFGESDSCNVIDYATPDVGIAPLPGNATALTNSINSHGPTGGTPTSAALEGAIAQAQTFAAANPGHVTIVVLATDGDPTSCNTDLNYINGVAAAGYAGNPSISTFVIGVGGSQMALDGFASAGGTGSAFMIDQDPNVQQAFLDAMNAIRATAVRCSFQIPSPRGELNYDQLNVAYSPGGGGDPVTLPRVNTAADCPPGGNAWYYDDYPPTQIVLCPETCATLAGAPHAEISLVLGCDTVVE